MACPNRRRHASQQKNTQREVMCTNSVSPEREQTVSCRWLLTRSLSFNPHTHVPNSLSHGAKVTDPQPLLSWLVIHRSGAKRKENDVVMVVVMIRVPPRREMKGQDTVVASASLLFGRTRTRAPQDDAINASPASNNGLWYRARRALLSPREPALKAGLIPAKPTSSAAHLCD